MSLHHRDSIRCTTHSDSLDVRKLTSNPLSKYADDYNYDYFSVCKQVPTAFISIHFFSTDFLLCNAYSKL